MVSSQTIYPITIDRSPVQAGHESNQAGAGVGFSVATAGDVNGDGYSDVIVGAPKYDNGETDEGQAFVFHGSATGLSSTANWTAESDQENAQLGYCVATWRCKW
ncbi:MAG: integrin alpha [Ignavibacteria bacterium]